MKRLLTTVLTLALLVVATRAALAFCGFYVAKADTKLFNKASQVVMVRDGDRTVLTMANDFQGDPKEFAIVIPVPTFIQRDQIHVADKALLDHLDAYSAPRLVEYFDERPLRRLRHAENARAVGRRRRAGERHGRARQEPRRHHRGPVHGRRVRHPHPLGQGEPGAGDLAGARTATAFPQGASRVLGSYLKQGMRFFVAKVNLKEQSKLGFTYLRPIQVAYESPKFMLPIRLGMVNANGPQELFVYALTRKGRVETTNYRTVRLPSDAEVPLFVKDDFANFYKAHVQPSRSRSRTCGPCSSNTPGTWPGATPARPIRSRRTSSASSASSGSSAAMEEAGARPPCPAAPRTSSSPASTCATTPSTSPRISSSRRPATARTSRAATSCATPGRASATCDAAKTYRRELPKRFDQQAQTLASLTGWDINKIRGRMNLKASTTGPAEDEPWWKTIWKD